MKRTSLRGTGLNGKGQGANAVLGGLRAQAGVSEEVVTKLIEQKLAEQLEKLPESPMPTAATEPVALQAPIVAPTFAAAEDIAPVVAQLTAPAPAVVATSVSAPHSAPVTEPPNMEPPAAKPRKSSTKRKMCTYHIDHELVTDLANLQAKYTLLGENIDKSEMVNAALRAYLSQLKAEVEPRIRKLLADS